MRFKLGFLILGLAFLNTACEDSQLDNLASAQSCLDHGTPDTANSCAAKVAGDDSQAANRIRCGASFLYQGFSNVKLVSIFDEIDNGGTASMNTLIAGLVFKGASGLETDATSAQALASEAVSSCQKSGSKGLLTFASFAKTSTVLVSLGNSTLLTTVASGGTISDADMKLAIQGASAASDEDLGSTVLLIQDAYCGNGSSSSVCTDIANILNGSTDPTVIGAQLRDYLDD